MERLLADAQKLTGVKYDINNLADVYEAIHAIQENLDITGTTAKEAATTFSGSFGMMKSAAINLMGYLGAGEMGQYVAEAGVQLIDAVDNFIFGNFLPMVGRVLSHIPGMISRGLSLISKRIREAGKLSSSEYITGFISEIPGLIQSMAEFVSAIVGYVIQHKDEFFQMAHECVVAFVNGLGQCIPMSEETMNKLPGIFEGAVKAIAALKLGKVLYGSFDTLKGIIPAIKGSLSGLAGAFGAISWPVAAVAAAVLALGAAFVDLWKNNEAFRDKMTEIWNGLVSKVQEFCQGIVERFNMLGFDFQSMTEVLKAAWDGFCSFIAPVFEGVWSAVASIISGALDIIMGIIDVVAGVFSLNWERAWDGCKQIVIGAWNAIIGTLKGLWDGLVQAFDVVLGWFGTSWSQCWEGIKSTCSNIWNGIVSACSNAWNGLVTGIQQLGSNISTAWNNAWSGLASFASGIWDGICQAAQSAWDTVCNVVSFGIQLVGSVIQAAVDIITLPWRFIWENCGEVISEVWTTICETVSEWIQAVSDTITEFVEPIVENFRSIWDGCVQVVSECWQAICDAVSQAWQGLCDTVSSWGATISAITSGIWNAILGFISGIWNSIVSFVSGAVAGVVSTVSGAWNNVMSFTSGIWNGIKSTITNLINGARTAVSNAVNGIRSTVSNVFNGVKSTVTGIWNGIKSAIENPINNAKNAVSNAVNTMKGIINGAHFQFPHIKLPHFSISGSFSLSPPSVPHLSIEWYKAGGILTQPTIFGANGASLMAGGEAGAEAVLPLSEFYSHLDQSIREGTSMDADRMDSVIDLLTYIADHSDKVMVMDKKVVAELLSDEIDKRNKRKTDLQIRLAGGRA